VRLRGELSGVKRAASGHLYCCLKDEGAVMDGVMWRGGAQRLDDLGERLRRGLADRAARARTQLQADSARLSAPLLRARVDHARAALVTVRLHPALLLRPLAERRERLAALARLALQLHPERPLQRGYVMVLDAAGAALTDAARAAKETAMTLKFRDGTLDVVPASGQPRRKPAPSPSPPSGEQPKLL